MTTPTLIDDLEVEAADHGLRARAVLRDDRSQAQWHLDRAARLRAYAERHALNLAHCEYMHAELLAKGDLRAANFYAGAVDALKALNGPVTR